MTSPVMATGRGEHLRLEGDSIDFVRRRVCDPKARIYDYISHDAAQALIQEHLMGNENRRLLIWSLLSLDQSCGEFL